MEKQILLSEDVARALEAFHPRLRGGDCVPHPLVIYVGLDSAFHSGGRPSGDQAVLIVHGHIARGNV